MRGKVQKRPAAATTYQLDAFAVGGIAALTIIGFSPHDIETSEAVPKGDGSVAPHQTVNTVVGKLAKNPNWRGQRSAVMASCGVPRRVRERLGMRTWANLAVWPTPSVATPPRNQGREACGWASARRKHAELAVRS